MITKYRLDKIKSSIVNEKELFNDDFEINKLRKKYVKTLIAMHILLE